MTVLSDAAIFEEVRAGRLGIDPFLEKNLTPNGYDLSFTEVMIPDVHGSDRVFREGTVLVPPKERFLFSTREIVTLPDDVCAQLWIRTSYGRRGVIGVFGKVEAGFSGTLTIPAFNASAKPVELPMGDRFCQIVFERLETPARMGYEERSGTYQHQRGVTLDRSRDEE